MPRAKSTKPKPRTAVTRAPTNPLAADDAAASAAGVGVSPRHARFALEYAIDGNGAAAARRSGYAKSHARQVAYELLRRPAVRALVDAAQKEHAESAQFTRDAVMRELGNVAFASLRDVLEIRGGRILLRKDAEIPPEAWAAIAELSESEDGRIRVKLHPKMQAIDFLGRTFKMWEGSGVGSVKLTVRLVRELDARMRIEHRAQLSGGGG